MRVKYTWYEKFAIFGHYLAILEIVQEGSCTRVSYYRTLIYSRSLYSLLNVPFSNTSSDHKR